MFKPVLGYAANLQNINFIHSQQFVQLLFGYILNNTPRRPIPWGGALELQIGNGLNVLVPPSGG
jgi:hypothetical protein